MKRSQKIYIGFILLMSLIVVAVSVRPVVLRLSSEGIGTALWRMGFLLLLLAIFRSMPLYLSNEQAVDISFIIVLAMVLTQGVPYALVTHALSTLICFERDEKGKQRPILLLSPVRSLFNTGIVQISVAFSNIVFLLIGGNGAAFAMPYSIVPGFIYSLLVMAVNLVLLLVLFALGGEDISSTLRQNIMGIFPNVLATAPIGMLLAYLMQMPGGEYILLLFTLPLMLARYSFKLYIDSKEQYVNMIAALSSAIEAKDPYTEGHSRRVSEYAVMIAQEMHLSGRRVDDLHVAALLHDIGKIGVSDGVLNKNGPLSDDEWKIVRQHPEVGYRIVSQLKLSETAKSAILHHHERFDGKGYPSGVSLSTLPLEVAILSIADAFDAMTSDRPYRKGMTKEKALSILGEEAGNQFHSEVVRVMERVAQSIDLP